jgi:hypothetical protein
VSDVVIVKDDTGKLRGLGEKGERAYSRFRSHVERMEPGETIGFKWEKPRSPRFHRMFFGMLGTLFDQQEQFADLDQLRAWLTVGAGYCEFVPGPSGRMVALPKSIAWSKMEDNEFRELVNEVWAFLRSEHGQRFLWPHLSADKQAEAVESVLMGWEA